MLYLIDFTRGFCKNSSLKVKLVGKTIENFEKFHFYVAIGNEWSTTDNKVQTVRDSSNGRYSAAHDDLLNENVVTVKNCID